MGTNFTNIQVNILENINIKAININFGLLAGLITKEEQKQDDKKEQDKNQLSS
jgi:hypothetical protein